MRDFKQFDVWRKSHSLTLDVYRATAGFPRHEMFGLTSQIRRSCQSIPANIAEGCGRSSESDFHRFLVISAGSASETEYHLLLAADLRYIDQESYVELSRQVSEIRRMLAGLMSKLKRDSASQDTK